jgi:hypothetical protein
MAHEDSAEAERILELWTDALKYGAGLRVKFEPEVFDTYGPQLIESIDKQLLEFPFDPHIEKNTKKVAKALGKVCRMFYTGTPIDADTFGAYFAFVTENHPRCPKAGPGGGEWCDIGGGGS